jgi:hypothetical protein
VDRASKIVKGILSRRGAVERGSRAAEQGEVMNGGGLGTDHRGGDPVRGAVAGAAAPAARADVGGGVRQHGHQRHRHSRPRRHLLLPHHHLRRLAVASCLQFFCCFARLVEFLRQHWCTPLSILKFSRGSLCPCFLSFASCCV